MVQILDLCVGAAVLSSLLSFKPFSEILYLLSFDLLMNTFNNVSNMFEKFRPSPLQILFKSFSFVQLIAELNKIYDLKIFTVDNLGVTKAEMNYIFSAPGLICKRK